MMWFTGQSTQSKILMRNRGIKLAERRERRKGDDRRARANALEELRRQLKKQLNQTQTFDREASHLWVAILEIQAKLARKTHLENFQCNRRKKGDRRSWKERRTRTKPVKILTKDLPWQKNQRIHLQNGTLLVVEKIRRNAITKNPIYDLNGGDHRRVVEQGTDNFRRLFEQILRLEDRTTIFKKAPP